MIIDKLKYLTRSVAYTVLYNTRHPVLFLRRQATLLGAKKLVIDREKKLDSKVAIVILTYNALGYVKKCLESLQKFRPENCEIIVVDNASDKDTVDYLNRKKDEGVIDKLYLSKENNYFSKGNNIGVSLASEKSEFVLLLNSDVEIMNKDWFLLLSTLAEPLCVVSLGATAKPVYKPDGWCYLISKRIYQELGGLNEYYKMNWGITELTGRALQKGIPVKTVLSPSRYIVHYGQRSYVKKIRKEKFNEMSVSDVVKLFKNQRVELFKI